MYTTCNQSVCIFLYMCYNCSIGENTMEKREYRTIARSKTGDEVELIFRPYIKGDFETAKILYQSWSNPQNLRYNEIPRGMEIDEDGNIKNGIQLVESIVDYGFPSEDGRYWMVIEAEEDGKRKVVGNCWFGNRSWDEDYAKNESWGFGYNIIRSDDKDLDNEEYTIEELCDVFANGVKCDKNWGKGLATAIINFILEQARQEGVKDVISGADILNYGSLKPMFKNGMRYYRLDREDKDPDMIIHLKDDNASAVGEQMETEWQEFQKEMKEIIVKNSEFYKERDKARFNKAVKRQKEWRDYKNSVKQKK